MRSRLDINKCEHFLYHLYDNGMIQVVAFGTRKLKFDSVESKEVPRAILICKYSHLIAACLESCKESGYEALSKSSLWRILHELKSSQQKSLAGLAGILATGMNGFQILLEHAKKSQQGEKTTKLLRKVSGISKPNIH